MKTLEKKVHFVAEGESVACYDSRLATGLHTMHCSKFASKVKSKCKELAKAAGEVW